MLIRFITAILIATVIIGLITAFVPGALPFVWLALSILLIISLGYLAFTYIHKTRNLLKQK